MCCIKSYSSVAKIKIPNLVCPFATIRLRVRHVFRNTSIFLLIFDCHHIRTMKRLLIFIAREKFCRHFFSYFSQNFAIFFYCDNSRHIQCVLIFTLHMQLCLHLECSELHCTQLTFKGKAIPLQTRTGPKVSSRLRLPDFKTIGT